MQIDETFDTEFGTVVFRGEVTDEELQFIIRAGLLTMLLQNKIQATFIQPEESDHFIMDSPTQVQ